MFCCTNIVDAIYTTFAYVYTSTKFEGSVQEFHRVPILELHIYWITEEGYHYWNCNWKKNNKTETKTETENFSKTETKLKLENLCWYRNWNWIIAKT